MTPTILISADEVMADIRSAAWLESEIHPELNLHRRHEMADICEKGNIEKIYRILDLAMAEVRMALKPALIDSCLDECDNTLTSCDCWTLTFNCEMSSDLKRFLCDKIHEYLVAAVMSDRCAVIIPSAAGIWNERMGMALSALSDFSPIPSFTRRPLSPF